MVLSDRFSSENFLMSVVGHLALVAVMVTSFAIVIDRAKLVAPDRIEILEIDLNDIQVKGDDTVLYNVNADATKQEEPSKESLQEVAPAQEEQQEQIAEESKPIETPSLVEEPKDDIKEEPKQDITEEQQAEEKKESAKEDVPAPKKKKVVRVNREVVSLDRTLTVSVIDALRVAMTRCWVIDKGRSDISDIRAVAHLTLRKNGTVRDVWFESAARAETDPAFAYVLSTIESAIDVCQPFKMLPENEFEKWEKIQLTFYPTQGKVM